MTENEQEELDQHVARSRGKLKIFLGALPGVGKTFTMLSEAHRRVSRGEDIVVGFVEAHGRPETEKLVEGLEVIPRKQIEYRGATFEEMNTDGVLARKPEWVLVDELAHTNIPGASREKRWQDVEVLLDNGINVISTVNVQHFESLNDIVFEITGVRVRETVPDRVIDGAYEIELVDLPPDALINRLKRGDIYHMEKVPQALRNFFRKGNITALREMALLKTADEVDEKLLEYMNQHAIADGWAAQERVLVALPPGALASKLVRRGYRLAKRLRTNFTCVFVRLPGSRLSSAGEQALQEGFALAKSLGGEVVEIEAESVAEEIIAFAKERRITFIVMGQSGRSRLDEIFRGSTINRIMRETHNIDVVVVADPEKEGKGA